MKRINHFDALHLKLSSIISFLLDMKKLDNLLQSLLNVLSIYLLYSLYCKEEFARPDYIMMIILGFAGFITIIKEAYWKKRRIKYSGALHLMFHFINSFLQIFRSSAAWK